MFGLSEKAIKIIVDVIQNTPEIEKAIIFGSRALDNYKNGSDVDIALLGENVDENVKLRVSSILNENTPLPYYFDVLNFNSISNNSLKMHIEQFGKVLEGNIQCLKTAIKF